MKERFTTPELSAFAAVCCVALLSVCQCFGQHSLQVKLDLQYTYMEYGRLHGLQAPLSLSYQVKNTCFGLALGWGMGGSDWNFEVDPYTIYNIDINRSKPPRSFWDGPFFDDPEGIKLMGGTGYGVRFFANVHVGQQFTVFGRPFWLEGGAYWTRVATSFIAAKAEDVVVYHSFSGNQPDLTFPTNLLFPVSVIYYDLGPFIGMSYQIAKDWRVPLGVSASYYHGFYDNSWVNVGLCFFLPVSKSLRQ